MLDISIIIINYNSETFTIKCIKSFVEKTSSNLNCEFIIIDNGSEIKSFKSLEKQIKHLDKPINTKLKLVRSRINTGFGSGNMIGIQHAKGKYYAFVNNDTILKNDCLSILFHFMEKNNHVGVSGPQAFTKDDTLLPTIDHFASLGRELFGRKILETINKKKYPKRKKAYIKPKQAQFIGGSFMFFRSEDFNSIGGFDTNIFLYHEETDLCKRLFKIKKLVFLVPSAEFTHYHGASTKSSIDIKIELKISLLYVIRKHYGMLSFYVLLTFLQIKYFFSSLVKPKYWKLFYTLILQAPQTKSLKHKQKIQNV